MSRQHWRWDRRKQDWVDITEERAKRKAQTILVRDIAPYHNVIDWRLVDGRAEHRAFLKKHDVREVGNETIKPQNQEMSYAERKQLREDVGKAYNMVNNGYKPDRPMTETEFRNIK